MTLKKFGYRYLEINMSKHRVKTHHWRDGILETIDHLFDSVEEALTFGKYVDAFHIKVYDDLGQLVHSETKQAAPEQVNQREESYSGTYA